MSINNFWLSLPLLLGFVFHRPLIENLTGWKMNNSRGRRSLVNHLVTKLEEVRKLDNLDTQEVWYSVNLGLISDKHIREKYVQLGKDEETEEFIQNSIEQSDWLLTQIYYNVAKSFLSFFLCQTDINGWLGRGSMFVLSSEHFKLLSGDLINPELKLESMLDLGAGDGRTTLSLANFYEQVYATEISRPMRRALRAKNFKVLEIDSWAEENTYDMISALNLFDRCDKPLSIIKEIHRSLKPETGLFLVALVLPFKPYVESTSDNMPSEVMNIHGEKFEEQVESSVVYIQEAGFQLISWSRVPYLCEGDLSRPLYHLNNVLLLFKKVSK